MIITVDASSFGIIIFASFSPLSFEIIFDLSIYILLSFFIFSSFSIKVASLGLVFKIFFQEKTSGFLGKTFVS